MRSPFQVVVPALVAVAAASVAFAVSPLPPLDCQYVHVVDPCQKKLLIYALGDDQPAYELSLDDDPAGQYDLGGIDFATVPEYGSSFVFVTQGPFLHVRHQALLALPRLVDLEQDLGLGGSWLFRVHAGEAVEIGSVLRYPLYAIGALSGEPWLLVFDQEALLAEALDPDAAFDPAAALLASGPVCVDGVGCAGIGIDVAAGSSPAVGGVQGAYASVLNVADGSAYQRFYEITLHEDLTFDVSFDAANEEGLPFSASLALSLGLDYDSLGLQAYGAFQTSSVIADLSDGGDDSCPLPGDPTDVVVWGPGPGLEHDHFHFVTTNDPYGEDLLLGFPVGECPDGNESAIELQIGAMPQALAVDSDTSTTPWVYTVSRDHGITAFHLRLSSEAGEEDRIEVDGVLDIPVDGCPYEVTIRDPSYRVCEDFPDGTPKPPKVDCEEDPDDPRCADRDKEKPVDLQEN